MARSESNNDWLHRMDEGVNPKDSALERWSDAISSRPDSTWKIYLRGLRYYCTRWGVTPQEIFEQRFKEIKPKKAARDYLVEGQIKRRAKRLMEEMQQEKNDDWPVEFKALLRPGPKSASTCNIITKALTSFFSVFGEKFALKFSTKDKVQGVSEGSDSLTNDQIKRALDFTGDEFPLRNKAIVLFLKDSGLRSSDLRLITLQDYRYAIKKRRVSRYGELFAIFNPIITQKEKIPANIIIGPETIEAVETYLKVERKGEDKALFTMRPSKRGDLRVRSEYVAMSPAAISGVVKRMIDRALGAEASTRTTQSLRNFHYNTLQYTGMPVDGIKWLQGKKQNTYHRGNAKVEDILSIYIEASPQLGVLSRPSRSDTEIKELKKELEIIKQSASEDLKTTLRVLNMKVEEQLQNERVNTTRILESMKGEKELDTIQLMEAYMKSITSIIGDNPRVTVEALNVFSEELKKSKTRVPRAL